MCPLQRDLEALGKKVEILSKETKRLCQTYPDAEQRVKRKDQEVSAVWRDLLNKTKARKDKLLEAEELQNFLNEFRDLRLERLCNFLTQLCNTPCIHILLCVEMVHIWIFLYVCIRTV